MAPRLIGTRDAAVGLQRAWMLGDLQLRGVPHAIPNTDEVVQIPASEAGRFAFDCPRSSIVRLSSQGRRRLWVYQSVQARRADVERLAREAGVQRAPLTRPEEINRNEEKEAARVEAAQQACEAETEAKRAKRADEPKSMLAEAEAQRADEGAAPLEEQQAYETRVAEKRRLDNERAAEWERIESQQKAENLKPLRQRSVGRPPGKPGVAVADAKKLDEFAARYPDEDEKQLLRRLKDGLTGTITKPSAARRARAAKAQRDASKESQKT
jgi:hypothetical protein